MRRRAGRHRVGGLVGLALGAAAASGLIACQAAPGPIVHTAPPEVFARTFPPRSASPTAASPTAASPTAVTATPGVTSAPAGGSQSPADSAAPVGSAAAARPSRGQIIFGSGTDPDSCSVLNPTDVLARSQPVFFAALLADRMDGTQAIVLHITKDGATIVDYREAPSGKPFECYRNSASMGPMAPGAYRFQVLLGSAIEADGSVTIL